MISNKRVLFKVLKFTWFHRKKGCVPPNYFVRTHMCTHLFYEIQHRANSISLCLNRAFHVTKYNEIYRMSEWVNAIHLHTCFHDTTCILTFVFPIIMITWLCIWIVLFFFHTWLNRGVCLIIQNTPDDFEVFKTMNLLAERTELLIWFHSHLIKYRFLFNNYRTHQKILRPLKQWIFLENEQNPWYDFLHTPLVIFLFCMKSARLESLWWNTQ